MVIQVSSVKPHLRLADYIPYQNGAEEVCTDNSSDFQDDFSMARSVNNFDPVEVSQSNLNFNLEGSQSHDISQGSQANPLERILKIEQTIRKMKKKAQVIRFTEA